MRYEQYVKKCNNHTGTVSTNCLQKFQESREENLTLYAKAVCENWGGERGRKYEKYEEVTDLDIVQYLTKKH